jgi:hypothetical protein
MGFRLRHSTAIPEPDEDMILPTQFYARRTTPERHLMAAVLERAMDDLAFARRHRGTVEADRLAHEVRAWIASDARVWPFSFANLCDEFGLGVEFLRRQLLRVDAARATETSALARVKGKGRGPAVGSLSRCPRVRAGASLHAP